MKSSYIAARPVLDVRFQRLIASDFLSKVCITFGLGADIIVAEFHHNDIRPS